MIVMTTQESLERRGFTQRPTFEGKAQGVRKKDKFYDKCQCPNCKEFFEVTNQRQKFCSNSCRQIAFQHAKQPIIQIEVPHLADEDRFIRLEEKLAWIEKESEH
jgi:hypothetical protein